MNTSNLSELTIKKLIETGNYYKNTRLNLEKTIGFILFILGLFGNLLIIFLMTRKHLSKLTISVYLISLAISDTCVLFFDNFIIWFDLIVQNFSFEELTKCKIFYPYDVAKLVSAWIITTISFDRFISVFYSMSTKKILTKKSCILRVLVITFVSFAINLYYLISIDSADSFQYDCESKEALWHQKIWPILFTFFYSIIPSILLILFNTLMIYKTVKSKKKIQIEVNNKKMNVTIVTICVSFVLLTLPANLVNIFTISLISDGDSFASEYIYDLEYQKKRSEILYYLLIRWITKFLMNLNHCLNFFLYILSSRMFRREILLILKVKSSKIHIIARTNDNRQQSLTL